MSNGILVLGIDPALRNTGWAVCRLELLEQSGAVTVTVTSCGVVAPKIPKDERLQASKDARRVADIARRIGCLLRTDHFTAIASEGPGGSIQARSATTGALAWGCVIGIAADHSVPVSIVTPQELKKQATGLANASKPAVAVAISTLTRWTVAAKQDLEALAPGKREHAYEAVAAVWALRHDRAMLAALRAGGCGDGRETGSR